MALGINKGGEYLQSKIDKTEPVSVSQETKEKLTKTKTTISSTIDVTSTYLKQLLKPVAEKTMEIKKDINAKIDNSSNESIIIFKHIALKQGRTVTVATWDAAGNVFQGLGGALSSVGDSLGSNTRKVVEKKYGEDVTNTFMGVGEKSETSQGQQQQQQQLGTP